MKELIFGRLSMSCGRAARCHSINTALLFPGRQSAARGPTSLSRAVRM